MPKPHKHKYKWFYRLSIGERFWYSGKLSMKINYAVTISASDLVGAVVLPGAWDAGQTFALWPETKVVVCCLPEQKELEPVDE